MEVAVDEKDLKVAGAELFIDGRHGIRIRGWEIESRKRSILKSSSVEQWEERLGTSHLPEMVFGDSCLMLKHERSGIKIHFNAFDALSGWKQEALPPVEVPAAAQWKFRSKPFQQVILDYDYTFTTPYHGSEMIEVETEKKESGEILGESCKLGWEESEKPIDVVSLASKEPILFYDEVVLYEDELADNGVSLLTVKVVTIFWCRESCQAPGFFSCDFGVDGVLMRLRDTRFHCIFGEGDNSNVLREICWREASFQELSAKGYPIDSASYNDPSSISQRLPVVMHKTIKLEVPGKLEKL